MFNAIAIDTKQTRTYATYANAAKAGTEAVTALNLTKDETITMMVVATPCGRFTPVFHLRNTIFAVYFAARRFYVFN